MLQRSEGSRYSSVRVWIEGHLKGMMKTLERSLVKRKCWITCAIPSSVHEVWCLKFYTAQQYYLAQNNFIAIAIEMGKLILTMLFLTVWFDELHNTSWWIIFLIYPFTLLSMTLHCVHTAYLWIFSGRSCMWVRNHTVGFLRPCSLFG